MSENGSSNTAIVAIVVLIIVAIGLAYFFGFFGKPGDTTKVIEKPVIIEQPIQTDSLKNLQRRT